MSVSRQERKAVLDLFPYFNQKHPIVFDVGSNKGGWADILAGNVSELHLWEPNIMLLHYSMVKFCSYANVRYNDYALADRKRVAEFSFFTNENNGLSNIINNPKWNYLPIKKQLVDCNTLDWYWEARSEQIDFLKIDVEGAEFMVLEGARNTLSSKRIKFIQVEHAEHIEVTGRNFSDLIGYLKSFGYIPMQTEDTENVIFMQEGFTQDWNGEFKKNTQGMKFGFALEIGCFEGLTSRYICDNLLNPGGRIICVDPLTDEYLPGHKDNEMFVGQYERFTRNTKGYPIELIRKKSIDSFAQLTDYRFDFVYVDGDHTRDAVFIDGCNAFRLTKIGGHILFDDYGWRSETAEGIEAFLSSHAGKYQIKVKGYQVMIQKTEN